MAAREIESVELVDEIGGLMMDLSAGLREGVGVVAIIAVNFERLWVGKSILENFATELEREFGKVR